MLEKEKHLGKFDSKTRKCIFIRYSLKSKAYHLQNPVVKNILKNQDIKFLDKFEENESETSNDFIDIEVMTNYYNNKNLRSSADEEIKREDPIEDERNEKFHSAEEEETSECFEDINAMKMKAKVQKFYQKLNSEEANLE